MNAGPLSTLFEDIEKAISSNLHYLAIAVCLTLPDVCSAAECEPDKIWTNQKKYEAWCAAYAERHYKHLTARDFYRLRRGVVHQGNVGRPDDRFERIIFILPNSGFGAHDNLITGSFTAGGVLIKGPILLLDASRFCSELVPSALDWLEVNRDNATVQSEPSECSTGTARGFCAPHRGRSRYPIGRGADRADAL